jgi:Flp pilus assembly CpaF family ATPase
MQFWLQDHATNERRILRVEDDPVTIGRDDANAIVLKSPFVARHHAQLVRRGNQMFVEALSQAGTRVANREVQPGKAARIDFGDEIQLGAYTLAPIGRDGAADAAPTDEQTLREKLMELERTVHADLLERLNLRVTGQINKSDGAFMQQVLAHLDQVIRQHIDQLDPKTTVLAMRSHLHRLVIAEVVRQCQGKVQTEYRADDRFAEPDKEQQITELVQAMVDAMPLLFDPASVQEDVASAEEEFDGLFDQQLQQMGGELRKYIVRRMVAKDIQDLLLGLGPLTDLLEMPSVTEIMVVGHDRIYIEKNGNIQPTTRRFFSDDVLLSIIERILAPIGRRVDTSTPLVDARLPDGSRVNAVIHPLSLVGPCLTIRKFGWVPFTMDDLIERGSVSQQVAQFLQGSVIGKANIMIAGGTASGKTTLLNVLSSYARPSERIITVEESAELQLPQPHVVRLEGRPANVEGRGSYGIRELVHNALRMRPDRLIVGEVRGPEAMDMLQAMNTGHDGSLSTVHANSPEDTVKRLESLVLMAVEMPVRAIREQIVAALDLVVQVTRFASGKRRVTTISEVLGIDPDSDQVLLEPIFTLTDPDRERLRHTGYIPTTAEASIERGNYGVEVFL